MCWMTGDCATMALLSGAREQRGTEGVAVACGVAPAGHQRRDRAGAVAPWSVTS